MNYPFKIENHQPFFMVFSPNFNLKFLKKLIKNTLNYLQNQLWLIVNYIMLLKWNQLEKKEKKGEQEKQAYQYQYKAAFGVTMST